MPTPVPMADQAGNILNRIAAEVSIAPVQDPFATNDATFVQLIALMNTAGEELLIQYEWEQLQNEHAIVTADGDSGEYPLPSDFAYMINQTGWERAQNVPLGGPLSPQDWQYLLGRDLVNSTIYASFRIKQGYFNIFPQPPPTGLDINFEYVGMNWVQDGDDPLVFKTSVSKFNDVPLYNRLLIGRYVKVKYYEAHQMDSTKAQDDFNQIFSTLTGRSMGSAILDAGSYGRSIPYLDGVYNVPTTGYGLS